MLSMLIHTNSFYIICLQTNSDESYSLVIFTQLALDAIVMLARTRMHPPAPVMLNTSFDGLRKCTTVSTPVHVMSTSCLSSLWHVCQMCLFKWNARNNIALRTCRIFLIFSLVKLITMEYNSNELNRQKLLAGVEAI